MMRTGSLALVVALVCSSAVAHAQGLEEVEQANQLAIENIDLGDWDAAKKSLVEALMLLEASGTGNKPAAARTHMLMGLTYGQGLKDGGRGLKHMVRAIELDEAIALDGHADDVGKALWAKAQQAVNPQIDCATLEGIAHKRVVSVDAGKPIEIRVKLGKALHDGAVELHYRAPGMAEFLAVPMNLDGDCDFVATIAPAEVKPPSMLYFVAAKTPGGKTAAASGSEARPVSVEVTPVVATEKTQTALRRQEEEVPDELQVGQGKGSSCGGCGAGGGAGGLGALGIALVLGMRRRQGGTDRHMGLPTP
jgi:hypothetical protein